VSCLTEPDSAVDRPAARRSLREYLPALAWAIGASAYFLGVYTICNWIASLRTGVPGLYFGWELRFPFVAVMIVPYLSEDVFFFFSPFLCRTRDEMRRHGIRLILAINIAALFFLLFPLRIGWPREPVSGANGLLFDLLRALDRPYNLAPSLHLALLVLLWVVYCRRTHGLLRIAIQIWLVLIGVSTVLTHQHHLIDVVTGVALGALCLYLVPDDRRCEVPSERHLRIGTVYALGAIACLLGAMLIRPVGLVLIWPAISLGVVAAGYFWLGPGIFRKSDGRIPPHVQLLLGPYLVGALIFSRLYRRRAPCPVAPGVFIGGRLSRCEARRLLDDGVTAVLDLTAEFSEPADLRKRVPYLAIPILDLTPPSHAQLREAVKFIEEHLHQGKVYVHCALGYSRSVCTAAAWLIESGSVDTAQEALAKTQARPRKVAAAGHLRVLRLFETGCVDRAARGSEVRGRS
jgi:protein-tyrosine phosphatase/membrane-associated phospholipid phosphatase